MALPVFGRSKDGAISFASITKGNSKLQAKERIFIIILFEEWHIRVWKGS